MRLVVLCAIAACGGPPDAGQDAAPPPQLLETLSVPSVGTSITSATTLELGVTYQLRVSGVVYLGWVGELYEGYCDADYVFSQPDGPPFGETPVDLCNNSYEPPIAIDCGLAIDDAGPYGQKFPKWDPYSPDHVYQIDYVGTGAPIVANIHDDSSNGGNTGALTLEIFLP